MNYISSQEPALSDEFRDFAKKVTTLKKLWEERRNAHVGIQNKINPKRIGIYKWYFDEDGKCNYIWLQYPGTDFTDWPSNAEE